MWIRAWNRDPVGVLFPILASLAWSAHILQQSLKSLTSGLSLAKYWWASSENRKVWIWNMLTRCQIARKFYISQLKFLNLLLFIRHSAQYDSILVLEFFRFFLGLGPFFQIPSRRSSHRIRELDIRVGFLKSGLRPMKTQGNFFGKITS